MTHPPKIYVAGHRGMVGSAIVRQLRNSHDLPRYSREGGNPSSQKPIIRIDPRYFRPTEVETLLGDPTKAKQELGWVTEITSQQMCAEMVAADLAQAKQHALLKAHGYSVSVSVE